MLEVHVDCVLELLKAQIGFGVGSSCHVFRYHDILDISSVQMSNWKGMIAVDVFI